MAAAGILFIQELIALTNRKYSFSDLSVQGRHVVVMNSPSYGFTKFTACPAHFGLFPGEKLPSSQQDSQNRQQSTPSAAEAEKASSVNSTWTPLIGPVHVVEPIDACKPIAEYGYAYPPENDIWNQNPTGGQQNTSIHSSDSYITVKNSKGPMVGSIGIVRRGGCVFVEKAYHLAQAGAIGVIVVDNKPETSSEIGPLFAMSGDNDNNDLMKYIHIPVVLLLGVERDQLFSIIRTHWNHTQEAMNIMLTKEYNLAVNAFRAGIPPQGGWSRVQNICLLICPDSLPSHGHSIPHNSERLVLTTTGLMDRPVYPRGGDVTLQFQTRGIHELYNPTGSNSI
ncbi:unnamed protein product [Trichobilharzia regenti]|nr:unnamed protein product [Trichobilharzia regenti]